MGHYFLADFRILGCDCEVGMYLETKYAQNVPTFAYVAQNYWKNGQTTKGKGDPDKN